MQLHIPLHANTEIMEKEDRYPGLDFKASEISAFAVALEIFIIALKNEKLVRFTPNDPKHFRAWLSAHGVRDVDNEQRNTLKPPETKPKRRRFF